MGFLRKIISAVFGDAASYTDVRDVGDPDGIYLYVKCDRCGAPVRVRTDKRHDLQRDYDTGGWILTKEIMDGGCFSLIRTTTRFDAGYRVIDQRIDGGEFISAEAYHELTAPAAAKDGTSEGPAEQA